MKKYHQLLLLIISIVSLTLFLIYRHEYNRLHYVLEVFNFFGQPCNVSDLQQTDSILSHHDWGPTPSWQEHESGYVYSAFLTQKNEAKALALSSADKSVPRYCYFWFEDRKKPVVGKFTFSTAGGDSDKAIFYHYYCNTNINQVPYAISFSTKMRKENELKKIMLKNSYSTQMKLNATICVSPSVYSKKRLLEFISFHKIVGIDSFIFYNRDIPHRLVKMLSNLSTRIGVHLTFFPWNYPKMDTTLTRTLIENDCILRTFSQSSYTTTLEMNEYLVPSHVYSFSMLMKDFANQGDRLSLPVQKFCINNMDNSSPISMVNTEVSDDTSYGSAPMVRYVYKNAEKRDELSTHVVDKGHASIHKYVKCSVDPVRTFEDRSILKFNTDLIRSMLVQLLIHDQI